MLLRVTRYDSPSRCSQGALLQFRWWGYPPCSDDDHIAAAVAALFAAVSPPGRVWNPWSSSMARAEFKRRLEKAVRGQLKPVDEVKPVDVAQPPPMYEIRWQDIAVANLRDDGSQEFGKVVVRLYHSEPPSVPDYFIGHHAHEKDVTAEDVNAAQDSEIAAAVGYHDHGLPHNWGIASEER